MKVFLMPMSGQVDFHFKCSLRDCGSGGQAIASSTWEGFLEEWGSYPDKPVCTHLGLQQTSGPAQGFPVAKATGLLRGAQADPRPHPGLLWLLRQQAASWMQQSGRVCPWAAPSYMCSP